MYYLKIFWLNLWLVPLLALAIWLWGAALIKWAEKRAEAYAVEKMPPSNKPLFQKRIARRINWLLFKRWWHENIRWYVLLAMVRRPVILLIIGLGLPIFIWWISGISAVIEKKTFALESEIEWRAVVQPMLILIGLPSAFILWAFRDFNAQANLENQRKDINLKEFQEIQMRAAGALDEKLPAKARETMQIAAIHQLRPFLRGEYGEGFRRPAWELLKARLAISAEESGYSAIRQWTEEREFSDDDYPLSESGEIIAKEIRDKIKRIQADPVTLAERAIIKEEYDYIFRKDLPLRETRLGGMDLSNAVLSRTDLQSGLVTVLCRSPISLCHFSLECERADAAQI